MAKMIWSNGRNWIAKAETTIDHGEDQLDEERRPGILVGVENPGHHEIGAHERGAERQDRQRLGEHHAVLPVSAGEEHAQRPGQGKQRQGTEDCGHSHGPQAMREGVPQFGAVSVLRGPGHAVEQHRGEGQGNDGVRQQVELAGDLQDGVAGQLVRSRVAGAFQAQAFRARDGGNAHDIQEGELPDGGRSQRPDAQLGRLAQAHAPPAEAGPQPQPEPEHRDQQDGGLG